MLLVEIKKLLNFTLDTYLVEGQETEACSLFNDLNIFVSNNYIDKFKIYCLIKSEKERRCSTLFGFKKRR